MRTFRTTDLAREHGLSTQAVRNYERAGFLPPAERTDSGYRVYTATHAAALRAYLALIPAYGHRAAGRIMNAVNDDRIDDALTTVDHGHLRLLRDRETLDTVHDAVDHLTGQRGRDTDPVPARAPRTIGELARLLSVTPATVRNWEDAEILTPERDPRSGYRLYTGDDVRDAELAHLLRRGGYPLAHIALVVRQIRTAGGTDSLNRALADWRSALTERGLAMFDAAALVSAYRVARG